MPQTQILAVALKGIIWHRGKVLIIKRSAQAHYAPDTWECVGGKLEFGEALIPALRREIMEEVGLAVSVGRLLYGTTFFTSPQRQVVLLTYLCRAESAAVRLSDEHQDFRWADEAEMRAMLPQDILQEMEEAGVWQILREEGTD